MASTAQTQSIIDALDAMGGSGIETMTATGAYTAQREATAALRAAFNTTDPA